MSTQQKLASNITIGSLLLLIITMAIAHGVHSVPLNGESDVIVIVLENEPMDPIILNCEYPIEKSEPIRTVKWSKGSETIYQWIPGHEPSSIPEFKDTVNDSFESSVDPQKQFSSLALINPTINTTGNYKCIVQTQSNTYITYKKLQVIDVRNYTFSLYRRTFENETLLECAVENVFPKPRLSISSDNEDVINTTLKSPVANEIGYFNSSVSTTTNGDDTDPDIYQCTLSFEGLSFNLTTTAAFDSAASKVSYHNILLAGLSVILFFSTTIQL